MGERRGLRGFCRTSGLVCLVLACSVKFLLKYYGKLFCTIFCALRKNPASEISPFRPLGFFRIFSGLPRLFERQKRTYKNHINKKLMQ